MSPQDFKKYLLPSSSTIVVYWRVFHIALLFITLFVLADSNTVARQYTTGGTVVQYQGPLDASDIDQILLRIQINVGNGVGTPTMNAMGFNFNSGNNVSALKLYTTDQEIGRAHV